jgi:LacI family transcriptional regulator
MKNKVTLHDIADELGLSIGTIDRALHDRPGINEATKARILKLVDQYQYKPDKIASYLSKKPKPLRIGVILQSVPAFFWSGVKNGILAVEHEFSDYGLEFIFKDITRYRKPYMIIQMIDELVQENADAILLVPINNAELRAKIAKTTRMGIKVVTLNDDIEDSERIFYVGPLMRQSGRIAGELMGRYLKGAGNVVVINGNFDSIVYQERLEGFKEIIQDRYEKIRILATYSYDFENLKENVDQMIKGVLDSMSDVTGIYDIDGASLYHIGNLVKKRTIPADIVIIGHEIWSQVAGLMSEGIIQACISQDPFAQGYYAAKLLYQYLAEGIRPAQERLFTRVDIIIRENLTPQENVLNPFYVE